MKILKSTKGLSLVEVLIVASILGFLGLAISTTFTDLYKMQSRITGSDEANEFGAALGRYFYTQDTCSQELQGQKFPVGGSRNLALTQYKVYDASGAQIPLKAGAQIGGKLKVSQLILENKGVAPTNVVQGGANFKRYVARVGLKVQSKVGNEWKDSNPRSYEFPVLVSGGNISQCQSSATVADACSAIGASIDDDTGTCVPNNENCFFEGHYVTNTCDGVPSTCEPSPEMCADGSTCPADKVCRASYICPAGGVSPDGTPCTPGELYDYSEPCIDAVTCDGDAPAPPGCPADTVNEITGKTKCKNASSTKPTGTHTWSYITDCGKKCTKAINVETKYFICLRCTGD